MNSPLHNCGPVTAGEIARLAGVRFHRATYVIRQLGIQPTRRVGVIRLFAQPDVARIIAGIQKPQTRGRKAGVLCLK